MSGFLEGWFARRREKAPESPSDRLAPSERSPTSALFPDAGGDAPSAEAAPSSAATASAAAGAAALGGTLVLAASAAHILNDHDAPPLPDDAAHGDASEGEGDGGALPGGDASADGGHDAAPSADAWDGDFGSSGDVGSGGDD